MEKVVDIIIPVYNAHDTIAKTLLSICVQACKSALKVYIIDDCSNKKYDYLIDMFKEKLDISIHRNKKKIGLGLSRNIGLSLSKSKYVLFLDSNKIFTNTFSIYELIEGIQKNDIALGLLEEENENGTICYYDEHIYNLSTALFKRSFIKKHKLFFPDALKNDDKAFLKLCLLAKPKINYIREYIIFSPYLKQKGNKQSCGFEEYKKCESLITNSLWVANEAKKRKYDMYEIVEYVEHILIYSYFAYQTNFEADYAFAIFEWIKPLIIFYNKHKKYINTGMTNENYKIQQSNWKVIPHTSWNSFIRYATHQANLKVNHKSNLKKNESLISIIIPVYNREKQIEKSLSSVLNQTYKNLEIIVIDDCSTDNSKKICEEYAKKDKRIKLIKNKKNKGVAETRNVGLSAATGEYIGFVDSDDSIEKDMFEKMIKAIKEANADFVQCSASVIHETNLFGLKQLIIDGNKDILMKYFKWDFFSCMVWDKLFTKEIISDTKFEKGWSRGEDAFFTTIIATKANRAVIIPDILYNYTMDTSNSLSKKYDFNLEARYIEINKYLENSVKNKYPDLTIDFYKYKITNLNWYTFDNLSRKNNPNKNDDIILKKRLIEDTISTIVFFIDAFDNEVEEYYISFIFGLLNKMSIFLMKNIRYYYNKSKKTLNEFNNYLKQVIDLYKKLKNDYPYVLKYIKSKKHDKWIIDDLSKK